MSIKPFQNLLDSWHESGSAIAFWVLGQRKDIEHFVNKTYSEELIEAIKLFHLRDESAVGWLVFTKSRIIFLIQQDMNHYDNIGKVVWLIDDIKHTNFDIKESQETSNEIEISEGKSILYESNINSGRRLVAEIKKNLGLISKQPRISSETKPHEKTSVINKQRFLEINNDYYGKASSILDEARKKLKNYNYDLSVRRSQESFELFLKCIFLFVNKQHPKEHDIGEELYNIRTMLNRHGINDKEIAKIVKESKTSAGWRETSFYGDDKLKVSGIFGEEDAKIALLYAKNISRNCYLLKDSIFRTIKD